MYKFKCLLLGTIFIGIGTIVMLSKENEEVQSIKNSRSVSIVTAAKKRQLPQDISSVEFGTVFTDHMFVMEWTEDKGWHNACIKPYAPFSLDPSSIHMHYGLEIFEGMKAYKGAHGKTLLFRPSENFARMNSSAKRLCMPEVDSELVLDALKQLIKLDEHWVPTEQGTSLYIRPTMIATEATINLRKAKRFMFFIIMSPVGSLYKNGFNPVSILASDKYTRASVGGVGQVKTGGNYAASMLAQQEAKEQGFAQVLWLDPVERKYAEEVGSMNIFFVVNYELVTPMLTGTILPGITRKSVIELAKSLGFKVTERRISIDEIVDRINDGSCTEIFGTGTAAGISPIGSLGYQGKTYTLNNNQTGPVAKKLYDELIGIQRGARSDEFKWIQIVN